MASNSNPIISKDLASAKAAIQKGNDLTKSVEGNTPSHFAPQHEYSKAPYKMAQQAKKPGGLDSWVQNKLGQPRDEGKSVAEGIKANRQNVEDYLKTYPQK